MTWSQKILGVLGLGAACFSAGWFFRGEEIQIQTVTKTDVQTQEKVVDRVITKVVTKIVKEPSGTVTTEITKTTSDNKTKNEDKTVDRDARISKPVATVPTNSSNYSIGVNWQPSVTAPSAEPTQAEIGWRVDGPVWLQGGFDWKNHDTTVGIRVDF